MYKNTSLIVTASILIGRNYLHVSLVPLKSRSQDRIDEEENYWGISGKDYRAEGKRRQGEPSGCNSYLTLVNRKCKSRRTG